MGLYCSHVFPLISECTIRRWEGLRAATLAEARGRVLEIGFGTGRNLPYYPDGVEHLTAVDPMTALRRLTERRIEAAPFPVELVRLPAESGLPFGDGEFDVVAMTWTLCTIADPLGALREMRRVLKPGGALLFAEHGLSEDPAVRRCQARLTPIQRIVACGCHLDRPVDALIREAGFSIERLERFVSGRAPRTHSCQYRGRASRLS